ncbi:SDR family NAD(P)-dependent oxidoreductase [Paenibacillus sp. GCM10027626]|uniref:SDR family NAD(P)-dependent oxidoreductase n=1 Tax=Paenibacillus sp. GCM10027626 TaxID=3273411 RepID=UPI00362D527D
MKELYDKTALITGSTSGIGRAAAIGLAKQMVKVCITGLERSLGEETAGEIEAAGGEALFVQADLRDPAAPPEIVRQTTDRWGRLDIVVNSAGLPCNKPYDRITHDEWDRLFDVNVKAAFFVVQEALPWLIQSKGVVINISSTARLINERNNLVYDTLKAALNHMTRGLALDLRETGVRVNAIMPGGTATPMLMRWFEQQGITGEEAKRAYQASLREEMVADPKRIADAIVMLAGDRASWINSAEIPVDGGKYLG